MEIDTEGTESADTSVDTPHEDSHSPEDSAAPEIQQSSDDTPAPAPYVPFSQGGKEKFKVGGKEFEWDWETTKRYAQIGRNGQLAMEKAANVEKKAAATYQQLLKAAQEDPEGLIAILNPKYQKGQASAPAQGSATDEISDDPRDLRIKQLEAQVQKFSGYLESQEVEQAKKEIDAEFEEASKKFPILKNEVNKAYVRSEYRRYLNEGITDISIEDLAFSLNQKIQEEKQNESLEKKKRLEEQRKKAPVGSLPGSSGTTDRRENESGIDYAKRLAGRIQ